MVLSETECVFSFFIFHPSFIVTTSSSKLRLCLLFLLLVVHLSMCQCSVSILKCWRKTRSSCFCIIGAGQRFLTRLVFFLHGCLLLTWAIGIGFGLNSRTNPVAAYSLLAGENNIHFWHQSWRTSSKHCQEWHILIHCGTNPRHSSLLWPWKKQKPYHIS